MDVIITNTDIAGITKDIMSTLASSLGDVNVAVAAGAVAIVSVALGLYAIKFVPKFGMGLFKSLSH